MRRIYIALVASVIFLDACSSRVREESSVTFTKLPQFGEGSSAKLDSIEGVAKGAREGQKIVVYARSGEWWIQPKAMHPFAAIERDATWKSETHPGTAYAALLVDGNYRPSLRTDVLPEKGGPISAIAVVQGAGPPHAAKKSILFAGYEWQIRDTQAAMSGTVNEFSADNAWTDEKGFLHLRISGKTDQWRSAEISLPRSLGYGSYRFRVRDVSHMEPSAVFTMMIFDETGPSREMDIEISKWGELTGRNGQFVIQPYYIPANTVRFDAPAGEVTFMVKWTPGRATFHVFRDSRALLEHTFTSGVPSPGNESVRMNLHVFGLNQHPLRRESELVVEAFEYLP